MIKCAWHCCKILFEPTKKKTRFCSNKCKVKFHVDQRRRKLKRMAVEYMGGKCSCGYSKSVWALEFHHKNGEKDFGISRSGITHSWEEIKKELDKCVMLCSNCHTEEHERLHNCQVAQLVVQDTVNI